MDVDDHDYKVHPEEKDESIETTLREIKVLQQLRDSKARNVNAIIDAFQMHSQLWIVTEYCPGGSLHTLVSLILVICTLPPASLYRRTILFPLHFHRLCSLWLWH